MVIIYERLENGVYQFIRLNFDTGEYEITNLKDGKLIWNYIQNWQDNGYIFIPK